MYRQLCAVLALSIATAACSSTGGTTANGPGLLPTANAPIASSTLSQRTPALLPTTITPSALPKGAMIIRTFNLINTAKKQYNDSMPLCTPLAGSAYNPANGNIFLAFKVTSKPDTTFETWPKTGTDGVPYNDGDTGDPDVCFKANPLTPTLLLPIGTGYTLALYQV